MCESADNGGCRKLRGRSAGSELDERRGKNASRQDFTFNDLSSVYFAGETGEMRAYVRIAAVACGLKVFVDICSLRML